MGDWVVGLKGEVGSTDGDYDGREGPRDNNWYLVEGWSMFVVFSIHCTALRNGRGSFGAREWLVVFHELN